MRVVELQVLDEQIRLGDVHRSRPAADVKEQVFHVQRGPHETKSLPVKKFTDECSLPNARAEYGGLKRGKIGGSSDTQLICTKTRSLPSSLRLRIMQFSQINKLRKGVDLFGINCPRRLAI